MQLPSFYWQFNRVKPVQDTTPDPFLNTKPLAQRILPEALITPRKPKQASEVKSPSILQEIGVDNPQLADILGRSLLKEAIESLSLKETKDQGREATRAKNRANRRSTPPFFSRYYWATKVCRLSFQA